MDAQIIARAPASTALVRHGHAAILEGAGRIQPFELGQNTHFLVDFFWQIDELDQRRIAFIETDYGGIRADREAVAVTIDEPGIVIGHVGSSFVQVLQGGFG